MSVTIEVADGLILDYFEPVAYRIPELGEMYLEPGCGIRINRNSTSHVAYLIVRMAWKRPGNASRHSREPLPLPKSIPLINGGSMKTLCCVTNKSCAPEIPPRKRLLSKKI